MFGYLWFNANINVQYPYFEICVRPDIDTYTAEGEEEEGIVPIWEHKMATYGHRLMILSYFETVVKLLNKEWCFFEQPQRIKQYNERMGDVDFHDQQTSRYSIMIRSKKCWWSIFSWCFTCK